MQVINNSDNLHLGVSNTENGEYATISKNDLDLENIFNGNLRILSINIVGLGKFERYNVRVKRPKKKRGKSVLESVDIQITKIKDCKFTFIDVELDISDSKDDSYLIKSLVKNVNSLYRATILIEITKNDNSK